MKLQRSSRASLAFSHSVALVLNSVRVVHLDRLTVFEDFECKYTQQKWRIFESLRIKGDEIMSDKR